MIRLAALVALAIALAACAGPQVSDPSRLASVSPSSVPSSAAPTPTPGRPTAGATPQAEPVTVVAVGDIASCAYDTDAATAALAAELDPDLVLTVGDNVYPAGSDETYAGCYDPAWGELRDITRPAIGNHDVQADGGAAYFAYFGDAAGTPGEGWYSYDVGGWHVVVLNSMCEMVGCGAGSAQLEWLRADLAASDAACTLALWHHPRFTSGRHGPHAFTAPFWEALHEAGAEVVLVGHDHMYERMAPMAPDGSADPERGIRQFTVGTGGAELYPQTSVHPRSEVVIDDAFGVLRLELSADAYAWSFVTLGGVEADAGSGTCH